MDWLSSYKIELSTNYLQQSQSVNPYYILRNSVAQTVIEKAENGDYTHLNRVLNILYTPFQS